MNEIDKLSKLFDLSLTEDGYYMNPPHEFAIIDQSDKFKIPAEYNCEYVFDGIIIKNMKEQAKKDKKSNSNLRVEVNKVSYSFEYLNEFYTKLHSNYGINELRLKHDSNNVGVMIPVRIDVKLNHKMWYLYLAPKVNEIEDGNGKVINVSENDIIIPLKRLVIKKKLLKYGGNK